MTNRFDRQLGWIFRSALLAMLATVHLAFGAAISGKAAKPTVAIERGDCTTSECHREVVDYAVLHGPVGGKTCDACHQLTSAENHTFELWREESAICTYCHEFDTGFLPVVHEPVIRGECLGCHNPHGGADRSLGREGTMEGTCNRCHEDISRDRKILHHPAEEGECTTCHRPHAAKYPNLLDAVGDDLCFSCHDDFQEEMQHVLFTHDALQDGCTTCHDSHGSNFPMGVKAPISELCLSCHEDIRKSTMSAVGHPPVLDDRSCLTCHTPHGGSLSSLMCDLPLNVCVECHSEDAYKEGEEILTAMVRINDASRFQHTPVRKGECGGCHAIHGGERKSLLLEEYSSLFYQDFSQEKYELCFECHDERLVDEVNGREATRFRNGDRNLHHLHVVEEDFGRNCRVCHGVHTSKFDFLIRDRVPYGNWMMEMEFVTTPTGATCMTGCHPQFAYDRDNPIDYDNPPQPGNLPPRVARADKAEPRHASFSATDVHGTAVTIPASGSPSVLLFIRGGQTLSEHVLEQVQEMSESGMEAHVVVIASGSNASDAAHAYGSTLRWPVIVDADYAIAGSLGVEVWPATLVVQEDGVLVAHIGGAPPSYSVDLGSYLALASGEIDRETLKTRMAEYRLLGDGAGERARWHLQMGRALLEKGSPEEAEQMLNSGLRFQPESVPLRIELVRVLVALKRGPEAQKLLESLPAESFEAHQGELLEGQVMAAMGRWSDARRLAEEVLADAPTNAEARYLLGMVHENAGDWERAAREYRAAMDSGRD